MSKIKIKIREIIMSKFITGTAILSLCAVGVFFGVKANANNQAEQFVKELQTEIAGKGVSLKYSDISVDLLTQKVTLKGVDFRSAEGDLTADSVEYRCDMTDVTTKTVTLSGEQRCEFGFYGVAAKGDKILAGDQYDSAEDLEEAKKIFSLIKNADNNIMLDFSFAVVGSESSNTMGVELSLRTENLIDMSATVNFGNVYQPLKSFLDDKNAGKNPDSGALMGGLMGVTVEPSTSTYSTENLDVLLAKIYASYDITEKEMLAKMKDEMDEPEVVDFYKHFALAVESDKDIEVSLDTTKSIPLMSAYMSVGQGHSPLKKEHFNVSYKVK